MSDTIAIPCRMHRGKTHELTLREAAVVIVTAFAMIEDSLTEPETYDLDRDQCVANILDAARCAEGYHEHVTSLLGEDAIDWPEAAR